MQLRLRLLQDWMAREVGAGEADVGGEFVVGAEYVKDEIVFGGAEAAD